MAVLNDAMILRVFIGEDAKFQRRPLYQAIVLKAREAHLAGATVLRGVMRSAARAACTPGKFCAFTKTCR